MRFVLTISMATLICLSLTQIAQAQNIDLDAAPSTQIEPRLQKGKRPALLKTAKDFVLEPVTTGLGNISALAYDGQTYLYASDRESGRVWRLSDRNRDGRYESKQALPHRFDNPSGIAIKNDHLYVADKNAVWSVKGSLPPSILAGLRKSGSKGEFHPLALSADGQTLILGLTTQSHETKILSIDTKTGISNLMEAGRTRSSIVNLSMAPNDAPWIITKNSLGMRPAQLTQFDENQNLAGLALFSSNSDWSEALPNHVILSRQSSHGFDIVATPTNFGQAASKAEVLLSGFLSSSGRTAWGAPSALVFDTKGLILSDSFNGDLYRLIYNKLIKGIPNPESLPTEDQEVFEKPVSNLPPSSLLSTVTGSQIESASSLDAGSNIAVGSTIVRDYKPLAVDKEEKEKKSSPKENN